MRGWDDPFSGDAARGDNKREKLQVVRPHVSNQAPLAHRTLPSFGTDQPRTPPALVNMRLCSLPSANTRFFPFPLRSCQALNDCARSTMRTASSTISLGCIPPGHRRKRPTLMLTWRVPTRRTTRCSLPCLLGSLCLLCSLSLWLIRKATGERHRQFTRRRAHGMTMSRGQRRVARFGIAAWERRRASEALGEAPFQRCLVDAHFMMLRFSLLVSVFLLSDESTHLHTFEATLQTRAEPPVSCGFMRRGVP